MQFAEQISSTYKATNSYEFNTLLEKQFSENSFIQEKFMIFFFKLQNENKQNE